MFARLLLCLAFVFPMVVSACQEEEKKVAAQLSCLESPDECFTSNDDEGRDKEEGKEHLASNSEDKDPCNFPLMDENSHESVA